MPTSSKGFKKNFRVKEATLERNPSTVGPRRGLVEDDGREKPLSGANEKGYRGGKKHRAEKMPRSAEEQ